MSDQRSATIRAVPFTDLFRSRGPAVASPQDIESRISAATASAFTAGQAAARAEMAQLLSAQAAAHDRALRAIAARHAAAEAGQSAANEQALHAIESAYAESLAPIAIAIARTITAAEPAIAAETLQSLLHEALTALPEGAPGTLFLPPGATHPTVPAGWRVAEDATLQPGSLCVRVDASVVTASLDRRFAQLASLLR